MKDKVYYDHEPAPVHIENHADHSDIWLVKNIQCEETEEGIIWFGDEVYGQMTGFIPSYDNIIAEFEIYYDLLSKWNPDSIITLESIIKEANSNIADLEDAVLELGEIIGSM